MTIVGRSQIDHPALGTAGGSALHAAMETIYTNIGNDLAGRYETAASVANSAVTTFTHNFGVQFSDLKVLLYTGTHPNLTRVSDPVASGWTIAANGGNLKTQIDVTAPSSGGPHTFAVMVTHGRGAENLEDLDDVDFTVAPIDGQLFIYDAGTSKWEPAFLRYTAETAAIASNTITPTTGTTMQRITSGTGDIQMIAGPTAGKVYVLVNETGSDKTIKNDTGATAANRIYTGTGDDLTLANQAALTLIYNSGLTRWVVSGGAGGGGGGGLVPTSVSTSFSATAGNNYLTNTSGGAITATLPAGSSGASIRFVDANETWGTNNLTITPASGETIDTLAADESLICDVNRAWVELNWTGSFWAFSSLASTAAGVASASSPGIVSTGTQSFGGNKTFVGSITPSGGIVGKTDGVAVGTGNLGEEITSTLSRSSAASLTSGNHFQVGAVQVTLTPGFWVLTGVLGYVGTATALTQWRCGYNTTNTALSQTEYDAGFATTGAGSNNCNNQDLLLPLPTRMVNLASNTTYYLMGFSSFSGGTLSAYGQIRAIRMPA